jgi:hypothetical protein
MAEEQNTTPEQEPTNLISIDSSWGFGDTGCQYCDSFAKPVQCSVCKIEGCEDCAYTVTGRRVCALCKDELEQSETRKQLTTLAGDTQRGLARLLLFPVATTQRHAWRPVRAAGGVA